MLLFTDDMKKMTGQQVHNANQFGNAWVAADNMGTVSVVFIGRNSLRNIVVTYALLFFLLIPVS